MMTPTRPAYLLVVAGTGTEIGKTWLGCGILRRARQDGLVVAARKPAQSFDASDDDADTDAALLAAASGEAPQTVCPSHRWYPCAMAPPMAADVLGRHSFTLAELLSEIQWPEGVDLGIVETAGGVRSPITHDADNVWLTHQLAPSHVLLVADAGLGTINAVRLAVGALKPLPVTVALNRFDAGSELHRRNRDWLERDGLSLCTDADVYEAVTGLMG